MMRPLTESEFLEREKAFICSVYSCNVCNKSMTREEVKDSLLRITQTNIFCPECIDEIFNEGLKKVLLDKRV